jgi:hypothetical protein
MSKIFFATLDLFLCKLGRKHNCREIGPLAGPALLPHGADKEETEIEQKEREGRFYCLFLSYGTLTVHRQVAFLLETVPEYVLVAPLTQLSALKVTGSRGERGARIKTRRSCITIGFLSYSALLVGSILECTQEGFGGNTH